MPNRKRKFTKKEKQYLEDLNYDGEGDEFYSKYQNMWIAVVNKQVVAYGEDLHEVEEEASRKTGKPQEEIAVQFIESIGSVF
ncbi:MAG: DUF5678 domain-containing protein [Verrucomicrobiota bacterium]